MKSRNKKTIMTIIGTIAFATAFSITVFGQSRIVKRNTQTVNIVATSSDAVEAVSNDNQESQEETITKSYTDEDLQYMVMVLTGECQNRSIEVQKKYGSVVLNRVQSPRYPNTIKEVCLQKGQYTCFRNGLAYRTPTAETIEAATWLLENGSVYPEYVVFQSRGRQGKGIYEKVQGEYFCY